VQTVYRSRTGLANSLQIQDRVGKQFTDPGQDVQTVYRSGTGCATVKRSGTEFAGSVALIEILKNC